MGTGTGRRAEIKGRRGDEFVKKAEAGQRHASGTSKRQDEMKSNRRHPARRIFSPRVLVPVPLFASPFLRVFAPCDAVSFFFISFTLLSSLPLSLSLSTRIPSRYFISVPTLSQCERAKGAEEARVRPERAWKGMGLKPFKRKGGP